MENVARRLNEALQLRGKNAHQLFRDLRSVEGGPPRGAKSYASVRAYVDGKTSPPLPFLSAVARILDVNESWLTSGEGSPVDNSRRRRLSADRERELYVDPIHAALASEIEGYELLGGEERRRIWETWRQTRVLAERTGGGRRADRRTRVAMARALGREIQGPLRELDIGFGDVGPWYYRLVTDAVLAALPEYDGPRIVFQPPYEPHSEELPSSPED